MNILVTGANGQLGNEMRIVAQDTADHYIFTDVVQADGAETVSLDITDESAIRKMVSDYKIDAIVNCAAYTNVDAAETNPETAELLNAAAPAYLARVMKEVGGLLVQISTDYVFGEEPYNVPCTEEQHGTPTGIYGRSKLHGEENIISSGGKYIIIRTAWLYSEFGKNFCKTMMSLTATKPSLKVVFDQVGTPTYAYDLATAIASILSHYKSHALQNEQYEKTGVYHYSNEGVCSWFDFAKMISIFNETSGCDIQPCHSDEYPSPVKRPSYSVLDKSKIKREFGVAVPYWTESLKKCIKNLKQM